uniref:LPXTG cell wall anchor domain-containing protein n=1 Tax=Planococcus sp. CAU13 TaxID=1541197 RepID=UPI00052FE69B
PEKPETPETPEKPETPNNDAVSPVESGNGNTGVKPEPTDKNDKPKLPGSAVKEKELEKLPQTGELYMLYLIVIGFILLLFSRRLLIRRKNDNW